MRLVAGHAVAPALPRARGRGRGSSRLTGAPPASCPAASHLEAHGMQEIHRAPGGPRGPGHPQHLRSLSSVKQSLGTESCTPDPCPAPLTASAVARPRQRAGFQPSDSSRKLCAVGAITGGRRQQRLADLGAAHALRAARSARTNLGTKGFRPAGRGQQSSVRPAHQRGKTSSLRGRFGWAGPTRCSGQFGLAKSEGLRSEAAPSGTDPCNGRVS